MKKIILPSIILLLLAAILLIGWMDKAEIEVLTPEDSAIRYIRKMNTGNFTINSNTVE